MYNEMWYNDEKVRSSPASSKEKYKVYISVA